MNKKDKQIEELIEALIWCSGSQDFAEGGLARSGWEKICKPLLDKHMNKKNIQKKKNLKAR